MCLQMLQSQPDSDSHGVLDVSSVDVLVEDRLQCIKPYSTDEVRLFTDDTSFSITEKTESGCWGEEKQGEKTSR